MKFHELRIENFLTIGSARVNLADRGLQLIQGANDSDSSATSNGAGKSSLVDAIFWCLYGVTARDVKGDAVINLAAKKDCRVIIHFSSGGENFHVARHRKHKDGKNSLVVESTGIVAIGKASDLSCGTDAETQKLLEKLLGASREVFAAAVYSGQEAMPDLPRMKDRELKALIEEAAGMQRIERAYDLARQVASASKAALQMLDSSISTLEENVFRARDQHATAEIEVKNWESAHKGRIDGAQAALLNAEREHANAAEKVLKLAPENEIALAKIKKIDDELAAHKKLDQAALLAASAAQTVRNSIDTRTAQRLDNQVKTIKAKIANAENEVRLPCPECGTMLDKTTPEEFVKHQEKHLSLAIVELEAAKVELRNSATLLQRANAEAATARSIVPDVSALSAQRVALAPTIQRHLDYTTLLRRLALDVVAAQNALALRKSERNPAEAVVKVCVDQLKLSEKKLDDARKSIATLREKMEIDSGVAKVFGPAGVRAQILDSVTPFLNARTADYLTVLSDGQMQAIWTTLTRSASGELKEKFSIDVTHAKGGDSFSSLSGGEKRKVRLATALALQDLVASRASRPIDLWIGDEIDDALDAAGLERLMAILECKARERGTVLVISHSDLKDWVDEVTTVRKSGTWQSTVEGSLCVSATTK